MDEIKKEKKKTKKKKKEKKEIESEKSNVETENSNLETEKNNIEIEKKENIPTLNNRYGNNEINSIINRDPLGELELIKQRIKNENAKIKQIDSQLEQISKNNNNKSTNKRSLENINDYYNNNKKINNLLYPNIVVSSSQQITRKNNSLSLDPSLSLIHQKMENLKKIKIERVNTNNNIDERDNYIKFSEKRNKSNLRSLNKIDLRLLTLEEEIKKEKEEKKIEYENKQKQFREREREREKERKKIIEQINNISSPHKNKYSPKKNYITSEEREEMRKMKEESLFQMEKEKRKLKYIPISREELNNFSNEVKKNEKIFKSELEKKTKQMEELWKERKNLLPKYHSKFMNLNIELDNKAKEQLQIKQGKLKNKELERANFGKEIIKNHQPKIINDILKTELKERIKDLNGLNKLNNIKELGNKLKQKSKDIVKSQPKNFDTSKVFKREETIAEKQSKKLTGKPVDFLLLCRNKKAIMEYDKLNENNSARKMKEWKEMLDCGGKDIVNNVERIKIQAAMMDDKANNLNVRIKQESNNYKKDELSQEASNLYINSIQAKLQILNKMINTDN